MKQLALPGILTHRIINIASVKHLSPFRYPGGKTWFVPYVRAWLGNLPSIPTEFIEPFAGGAIVGLTVARESLATHITLVEIDSQVAAVWQTILENGEGPWLAERIASFEFSPDVIESVLAQDNVPLCEKAFQTIIKNRINHGGILANGAGRIKNGENKRGLASRWYPASLSQRILDLHRMRDHLTFIHGDGMMVLNMYRNDPTVAFFIDPPYTISNKKPGKRLYDHAQIDHHQLFKLAEALEGNFLMTYENTPEIIELAQSHNFDFEAIPMKNTHHAKLTELVIGRDLAWIRI